MTNIINIHNHNTLVDIIQKLDDVTVKKDTTEFRDVLWILHYLIS